MNSEPLEELYVLLHSWAISPGLSQKIHKATTMLSMYLIQPYYLPDTTLPNTINIWNQKLCFQHVGAYRDVLKRQQI